MPFDYILQVIKVICMFIFKIYLNVHLFETSVNGFAGTHLELTSEKDMSSSQLCPAGCEPMHYSPLVQLEGQERSRVRIPEWE